MREEQEALARDWLSLFDVARRGELFPEERAPALEQMLKRAATAELKDLCVLMDLPVYGVGSERFRERIQTALAHAPGDPEPLEFPEEVRIGFDRETARRQEVQLRNQVVEQQHRKRTALSCAVAVGVLGLLGGMGSWIWFLDVLTALAAGWRISVRRAGHLEGLLTLGIPHGLWVITSAAVFGLPGGVALPLLLGGVAGVAGIGGLLGVVEDTRDT